ncbi:MAG TPA: methylenetetrahydrofolate reductase [Solirubrobacteraceae bacterium]|nr:methylenetetrahydrofolate reductase [Solirubrobacteraceae bacterium]
MTISRFEILPFARGLEEAARLPEATRLTVTCSPRHGVDHSVAAAVRLRGLGHDVAVHLAARTIRDAGHLDRTLEIMADAGITDALVIGGDGDPQGEFDSAGELLALIADHPRRPASLGIAGYPEGHPKIAPEVLAGAMAAYSRVATYVTTQMCFDPGAVLGWIAELRRRGVQLPVLIGLPGQVDRRRLLDVSLRVGVGPSLGFVRRQRGVGQLLRGTSSADRLLDGVTEALRDPQLKIAGFHYFTFDQLLDTWTWDRSARSIELNQSHRPLRPQEGSTQ